MTAVGCQIATLATLVACLAVQDRHKTRLAYVQAQDKRLTSSEGTEGVGGDEEVAGMVTDDILVQEIWEDVAVSVDAGANLERAASRSVARTRALAAVR